MNSAASVALVIAALGGTPEGEILNFSASWCPGCQRVKPTVQRLQKAGLPIRIVDTDRNQGLARRIGIDQIPAFVLMIRGKVAQRVNGPMTERELRQMARLIPIRKDPPAKKPGRKKPAKADEIQIIRGNGPTEKAESPAVAKESREVCTRIRVRDERGIDIGSGTVIHSEPGRTLILTCGHIFRHFNDQGRIEVDIFTGQRPQMLLGKLVHFRLEPDIGLISVPTPDAVPVARVAQKSVRQGQHVFSVGCGGGDPPSRLQHRVTDTQHYQGGYIECTGVPRQGRSGGGLFTLDGQVAGVCVFANPDSRRGLYTGLDAIHRMLDRLNLASLYKEDAESRSAPLKLAAADPPARPAREVKDEEPPFDEAELFPDDAVAPKRDSPSGREVLPATTESARSPGLKAVQQIELLPVEATAPASPAAPNQLKLDQRTLQQAVGSEIVCVIRPRDGRSPSRVVIVHRASEQFVNELTGELKNELRPTSLPVRFQKPRQAVPALQHSASNRPHTSAKRNFSATDPSRDRGADRRIVRTVGQVRLERYRRNRSAVDSRQR